VGVERRAHLFVVAVAEPRAEPVAAVGRLRNVKVVPALLCALTLAGVTSCGGDGTTTNPAADDPSRPASGLCFDGVLGANLTKAVTLGDGAKVPVVDLRVGNTLVATVRSENGFQVTAPVASPQNGALCPATKSEPGTSRSVTFTARKRGTAYIGATISGVAGGIDPPAYGARVRVR
jgi:hypothetical protein